MEKNKDLSDLANLLKNLSLQVYEHPTKKSLESINTMIDLINEFAYKQMKMQIYATDNFETTPYRELQQHLSSNISNLGTGFILMELSNIKSILLELQFLSAHEP